MNATIGNSTSAALRCKQFDEENGGDSIRIGNWLYYGNGAKAELSDETVLGVMVAPPEHDRQRLKLIIKYREVKLERARKAFDAAKRDFVSAAQGNVAAVSTNRPDPWIMGAEAELKKLRKAVRKWQKELDAAREEYEAAKPEAEIRREKESEENKEAYRQILTSLNKIKI